MSKSVSKANAERLMLMLNALRLPATKSMWQTFAERADTEGWPAARFLSVLIEHEIAEREQRRLARHLNEAHLLAGKTIANFDFSVVPMVSKAQVNALAEGDAWIDNGDNLLLFGKRHGIDVLSHRYFSCLLRRHPVSCTYDVYASVGMLHGASWAMSSGAVTGNCLNSQHR